MSTIEIRPSGEFTLAGQKITSVESTLEVNGGRFVASLPTGSPLTGTGALTAPSKPHSFTAGSILECRHSVLGPIFKGFCTGSDIGFTRGSASNAVNMGSAMAALAEAGNLSSTFFTTTAADLQSVGPMSRLATMTGETSMMTPEYKKGDDITEWLVEFAKAVAGLDAPLTAGGGAVPVVELRRSLIQGVRGVCKVGERAQGSWLGVLSFFRDSLGVVFLPVPGSEKMKVAPYNPMRKTASATIPLSDITSVNTQIPFKVYPNVRTWVRRVSKSLLAGKKGQHPFVTRSEDHVKQGFYSTYPDDPSPGQVNRLLPAPGILGNLISTSEGQSLELSKACAGILWQELTYADRVTVVNIDWMSYSKYIDKVGTVLKVALPPAMGGGHVFGYFQGLSVSASRKGGQPEVAVSLNLSHSRTEDENELHGNDTHPLYG